MSEPKGFSSPNYTQTPNNLFDMLPDMDEAELRVTLVMIRHTFGWHRSGFKMGIKKLAAAAGLSPNGARAGAEAAEARGTFRRANPDDQGEAEWELVVGGAAGEPPAAGEPGGVQPVNGGGAASAPQVGVLNKDLNKYGASAAFALPIDWQIAAGVSDLDNTGQKAREMIDSANLIATGAGTKAKAVYDLAMEFMAARHITIPPSAAKGNRKAAVTMVEAGVRPEHVRAAVQKLTGSGLTCTDLYSVMKTAIDLANPQKSFSAPIEGV